MFLPVALALSALVVAYSLLLWIGHVSAREVSNGAQPEEAIYKS
jgi:hypothetical protein